MWIVAVTVTMVVQYVVFEFVARVCCVRNFIFLAVIFNRIKTDHDKTEPLKSTIEDYNGI